MFSLIFVLMFLLIFHYIFINVLINLVSLNFLNVEMFLHFIANYRGSTNMTHGLSAQLFTFIRHSVPIKVWSSRTDGHFLELTTEVSEVHPEFPVISLLYPHQLLRLPVHPVPARVTGTQGHSQPHRN